jgi:hypothetical protein
MYIIQKKVKLNNNINKQYENFIHFKEFLII